ncbi:MAG: tetratricopeptide repeat protein, partial [Thermodesulfobacteriota bacterium]|nr:tetratricopeptide repeat protein [Thermodesulfobacteriota bacterium]
LKYNADPQDYVEAMKWFKKASDQGDVDSAFKIACLYKNGLGVPKNDAEATKWFQKAADQGHSYSKKVLFDRIEKGPFYNLPGGKLIDAIYRNDMKTVKEVEITSGLKSLNSGSSLLNLVANKYMYAFNQNWPYCHQREKRRRRFSVTIKEKKYENIYGMDMGSIPSWTSSATYVVPKEFYYLLERLGSNMGSDHMEMAAKYFRLRKVIKIFDGIDILQQTNKCDSPDIKQFEKNLISLTTRSSEWKSPGYIQSNEKKMSQSDVSKPKFAGSWETIVDNQRIEMVLWDKPNKKEQFYGIVYAPNHDCIMVAHLGKHKGKWRLDFGCREASDRKNNCTSNIKGLNKDFFGGFGAAAMDTASDELTLKSNYFLLGYFVAGNVITAPDGKKIKTKIGLRFKRKSISNELLEILKFYKLSGGNPDQKFLDEIKKG